MINSNVKLDTRQTFYYARELYYNKEYDKSIHYFNKFLSLNDAWEENKISSCIDLHYIYLEKNNKKKAMITLFSTFEYSLPKAEICCHIANIFMSEHKYYNAIFWLKQALNDNFDIKSGGFYNKDYYAFIPYIQLCVCYYNIGDIKNSINYNLKAGKIKPYDKSYIKNLEFFKNIKNNINNPEEN